MEAGRALDALIAEKVMGWKRMTYAEQYAGLEGRHGYRDDHRQTMHWHSGAVDNRGVATEAFLAEPSDCIDCGTEFPEFAPSTRIDHAWEVVQRWYEIQTQRGREEFGWESYGQAGVRIFGSPNEYSVQFDSCEDLKDEEHAKTLPHAICLAALKAVGTNPANQP